MLYMPRSKGGLDFQIFSFCLTDKLGSATRFDGSLSKWERKYSQGWQRSLSFFLYLDLAKVVMTLGSRNASLCTYPIEG